MLSPVVLMDLRQARTLQRASVVSEMFFVHHGLHVIAIAIAIERRRAAMRAAHQLIAALKLRLLTLSDRRWYQNNRHA